MKTKMIIYTALVLVGIFLMGCSERSNPAQSPYVDEGMVFTYPRAYKSIENNATWEFFYFSESKSFDAKLYAPPGELGEPRPILYLLHDFQGDQNFYFNHLVHYLADSLIAIDEIPKMYIVTVDATTPYGGTWYVNNDFFGYFEDMVSTELIQFVEDEIPQLNVIKERASRAIGGFGMGGYGALKIASKYPGQYASVSASNCAGAFHPSVGGMRSIPDLIPEFLDEQGLSLPIDPEDFSEAFDTTGMYRNMPYTLLFFSMAQAFSPHPIDEEDPLYLDSTTFLPFYGVDLPFDYNGNLYQPVWEKWESNDISVFLTDAAEHFDSIEVYLEYSDADQFGFNDQTQNIMVKMDDLDIEYESNSYTGYTGYDATNQRYIYDRLVEILKFHARNLDD